MNPNNKETINALNKYTARTRAHMSNVPSKYSTAELFKQLKIKLEE